MRGALGIALASLLSGCTEETAPAPRELPTHARTMQPVAPHDPIAPLIARAGSGVRSVRETALAALEVAGTPARTAALQALSSPDSTLRKGAANTLARIADTSCSAGLVAALARGEDDDPALFGALVRTGTAEAGEAFVRAIETGGDRRGIVASSAVCDFTGPLELARLRAAAASDRPSWVRRSALWALTSRAAPCDRDLFQAASRDPATPIRAAAARGLFAIGDVTAADVRRLVVLDTEEAVRATAARAAARLPLAVVLAPLSEAMASFRDDDTVPAAIGALASHREPAAFEALLEFVRDDTQTSDLRGTAIRAMAAMDHERTVAVLKQESAVFDTDTRDYCDEILATATGR